MNQITEPSIRLHTSYQSQGTHVTSLILTYNGNNYHLEGGTGDTIHVFQESVVLYVLNINRRLGYIGLNAYIAPEPDPINSLFLSSIREIREYLEASWENLEPEGMVKLLVHYLY